MILAPRRVRQVDPWSLLASHSLADLASTRQMRDSITEKDKEGNCYLRMILRFLASFYIHTHVRTHTHTHTHTHTEQMASDCLQACVNVTQISCVAFSPLPKIVVSFYICKYFQAQSIFHLPYFRQKTQLWLVLVSSWGTPS